ncbi:protoheme IX farnesyltransferase mitochondrial precursor [Peziza echinospora]|nr:protoheme IX farnesyltransferase mitochondrial precursor [Peziza echinospora]
MLLQRTRAGAAGGPLVCLRCYLKIASSGGGARRTISTAAAPTVGSRLQPFFDRSGPAFTAGVMGKAARVGGGYFFANERLFVGGRRMIIGAAGQAPVESDSTAETVKMAAAETVANAAAVAAAVGSSALTSTTAKAAAEAKSQAAILQALPAHRRRQFLKAQAAAGTATASLPLSNPDASDLLTTAASETAPNFKRLFFTYLSLTKPRLTVLVVLSAACSYALFPLPPLLASADTPSLSTLTLLYLTVGTTLASASANTFNMYLEPKFDAQMSRTRNRPLARGLLTQRQALIFAILTGGAGTLALWFGVNPTVSGLGALNIFLYAGVYTPLKRISIANTWIGAVVGGIPPLMGWAAAAGGTSTIVPSATNAAGVAANWMDEPIALLSHPGSWILAMILFSWQFPHFCALSTPIAAEYKNAGYQMMSWKNPALNTRVALRYSLLTFPLCFGLTYVGVTDYGFVFTSSIVNAWLVKEAWTFWKSGGAGGSARGLFWASVWHLPVVMVLAMVHKEGLWRRVYRGVRGVYYGDEEEEEDWLVES